MTEAQKQSQLSLVDTKLTDLLVEKIDACPKHFNKTRFAQNCMTVLKEVDPAKLAKVSPESVALTMIKGAFLGLDFFNRECYAIPFGNELQFLTDYKGDIKLCRQYSIKPIKNIYAKLVREGDTFECVIREGTPVINFTPNLFSDAEIKGAFAVVVYEDESMDYTTMSKKEIEATRHNFSKCPTSPAWAKAWGEMAKKTALKRLTKMVELNFDNAEQAKAFQEGADIKREAIDVSPEVVDPFKDKPTAEKGQLSGNGDGAILQVQAEIEKMLVIKQKEPSLVYKYSMDIYKKKLDELNFEEIIALRDKIANGAI